MSEGALLNMFIRSHLRLRKEAEKAKAILRAARVVASDETGVPAMNEFVADIEGTNSCHWVSHCKDAVVHQPDYSRAARVVDEMMDGRAPEVCSPTAIRPSNLTGSGIKRIWRIWRDTVFALEHGSNDLPFRFKLWLGKVFNLAKAIFNFAASTVAKKKRDLEKQLAALLVAATGCDLAHVLQAKVGRARDQLLTHLVIFLARSTSPTKAPSAS